MIEWTDHIDKWGFKYSTCKFGGLVIALIVGNFSIGYFRDPKMEILAYDPNDIDVWR